MSHPDCSCCASWPCERTPDIWQDCMMFSPKAGAKVIPPLDWRPDWGGVTPEQVRQLNEADARYGLPASLARWEEKVSSGLTDTVYQSNAFEL